MAIKPFKFNFIDRMLKKHRDTCSKLCPRACEETSYDVEVSSAALGDQSIFQRLSEMKSWNKSISEAKSYVR